MQNIKILKYSSNKWITDKNEIIEALRDILINNSTDYSYTKTAANETIKHFNIKL